MKKTAIFILLLAFILQAMTACRVNPEGSETSPDVSSPDASSPSASSNEESTPAETETAYAASPIEEYKVLLYMDASGGAPEYTGEDLHEEKKVTNSDVQLKKQITISENEITLHYDRSTKKAQYKDNIDFYSSMYDGSLLTVAYNSATGKLVHYKRYSDCTDRDYKSEVTPQSSEADFLAYVKKILSDDCGISVEGRKTRIVTEIVKESGPPEFESKFVNYSDTDPNFNAHYMFVFYSDFNGVPRADDVIVEITNVGEIQRIEAMVNDEGYRPFENVSIDRGQLDDLVSRLESSIKNSHYNVTSCITELLALPSESGLWVEITIRFHYENEGYPISSGAKYLVKVAELTENKG